MGFGLAMGVALGNPAIGVALDMALESSSHSDNKIKKNEPVKRKVVLPTQKEFEFAVENGTL